MKAQRCACVRFSPADQEKTAEFLRKGKQSVRVMKRVLSLQQLNQGRRVMEVAANVGLAPKTVRAIAYRYQDEGLESAWHEKPRPAPPLRILPQQRQRIIAMVCGPAPEGQARWTVRLIAREAVKRKLVPSVGRETVRILLQTHELKPWREKNVVRQRNR